jgi:hypothetical protein
MAIIKNLAREQFGGFIFQYLDDWLLLDRSPGSVLALTRKFVAFLLRQGIIVNLRKLHLVPT